MPRKPILCLDFDGVIHSYTSGWTMPDEIRDPPVPGAFTFLSQAVYYYEVHIFSSRSVVAGFAPAAKNWFTAYGLDPEVLDQLRFPVHKPPATISIDDRGFLFTGTFPDPSALLAFSPWNRSSPTDAHSFQQLFQESK